MIEDTPYRTLKANSRSADGQSTASRLAQSRASGREHSTIAARICCSLAMKT